MSTDLDKSSDWRDSESSPNSPLRAFVARALLERMARNVEVIVRLPDGTTRGHSASGVGMEIVSDRFFHRLGSELKIGLGEAYMAGDWRAAAGSDLADVLTPFAARLTDLVPAWMRKFRRFLEPLHPEHEENHLHGARENIARHYDLSNALFSTFLDETMTYSSAWFEHPADFAGLADAQRRKIDGVLDFAGVRSGSRVLEIGTGWGELAIRAASRGATVLSVTLSQEQKSLAEAKVAAAGLQDRVRIALCDYRDVEGEYDAIVSVEMIEAVGVKYWPTYFATVGKLLAPGGRFGIQAITMPEDRLRASQHAYTWIHKYIFPGGVIPSPEAIANHSAMDGHMRIVEERAFGLDYADTLRLWRHRFMDHRAQVQALGFDETFQRMWEFYLAYSEAGFRSGHLNVRQYAMERSA